MVFKKSDVLTGDGALLMIALTGIMLLLFALVARQPIRSPGFPPSADPHSSSSSFGCLGVEHLRTGGLVRLLLDLLRRIEEQEVLPHPICGSGGAEWRIGDRGSFHLPSCDSSGAAVEKREHRPEQPSPRATALPARLFVIRVTRESRPICTLDMMSILMTIYVMAGA